MDHPDPTETLQRTIALATANVADGGGPFGAVVRLPGGELVEGVNRVTATNDPTAHAEVAAIREACARSGSPELRGAVLYSSCEPCPMCMAAALWARLDLVVFAAGRGDAARAGFDDSAFYDYFARSGHHAVLPVQQHRHADAVSPFDAWLAHEGRTAY